MPDLSSALQECLEAVREKRNLQEILRRYPAEREELVGMLRLSVDLSAMGAPAADPAFRLHARNRMLALAADRRQAQQRAAFNWLPRRVVRFVLASAAALVPVAAGFTVAAASNNSLPGDALYGVKLSVEQAELAVTFDAAARTRMQLQFADLRLDEAQRLYTLGRSQDAVALINQYNLTVSRLNASLASSTFDQAAVDALTGYLKDRQAHADASLNALAGSFKAQGDAATAAMLAQDQAQADQAFKGGQASLLARAANQQGGQASGRDNTHQPKTAGQQH